jgi:type I restriction enzyme S subunit
VQELEDRALVSPIYVVMEPKPGVDSYFLQRLLKLDSYRQKFSQATNASVDRRGSLRWPEFSRIEVDAPESEEQRRISRVLRDSELEIAKLQRKIRVARDLKQGMAQELLSGKTRLSVGGAPL